MSAAVEQGVDPAPDAVAIRAYLETLYGTADGGFLPVFRTPGERTDWLTIGDLDMAAAVIQQRSSDGFNVYHGMGLYPLALESWRRGTTDGVCALPGLHFDLDVSSAVPGVHAETRLPSSIEEAIAFLGEFPLPASVLIFSGHGLYAHWLFREVLTIDDEEERARVASALKRLQGEIRRQAQERGWFFESTADLARVLRPAGVLNRKTDNPILTRLLHDSGERYLLEEIEDVLPDQVVSRNSGSSNGQRAALRPILEGCPFLAHCLDDAETLTEPEWHSMMTVVACCEDGESRAHALSKDYPRYERRETQRKYERANAADKPIRCETVQSRHGDDWCGGCQYRKEITSPLELGYGPGYFGRNGRTSHTEPEKDENSPRRLPLTDFVAHLETHKYVHRPTGKLWPRSSVNATVPPVLSDAEEDGSTVRIPASTWLDQHEPIHQMTWSPGDPEIIEGRLLHQGGWVERDDLRAYNLYHPPKIALGDSEKAGLWIDHAHWLYQDNTPHIIMWLAHRVQHPAQKINHALLLGSMQGCGKDTLLKPVRDAVGPWNYADASPSQVVGRFNGFLKSVILLVPELCDLGDLDRYKFYEHMKPIIAAPPTTLRCDEKFLPETEVLNVCGVVFTSNQRIGIYLPAGDRRHFAAWSTADPATLPDGYFDKLHRWLDHEDGSAHVAAYLHSVDLSDFNPSAPPLKTEWFWSIADAGRAPEESELATLLDWMARDPSSGDYPHGGNWPEAVTLAQLVASEKERTGWTPESGRASDFVSFLEDRKNRRQIPHRMEAVGYFAVRNDGAKDGLWSVGGVRIAIYARQELSRRDQLAAAGRITSGNGRSQ